MTRAPRRRRARSSIVSAGTPKTWAPRARRARARRAPGQLGLGLVEPVAPSRTHRERGAEMRLDVLHGRALGRQRRRQHLFCDRAGVALIFVGGADEDRARAADRARAVAGEPG